MTIHEAAKEARSYFTLRPGTEERPKFWSCGKDAPDWVMDFVRAAHDNSNILPDDTIYEEVVDALDAILDADEDAEADDLDETRTEFADGGSVYNYDMAQWFASHTSRGTLVDEAVKEFGYPGDIFKAIGYGMYREREMVWDAVVAGLEDRLESLGESGLDEWLAIDADERRIKK